MASDDWRIRIEVEEESHAGGLLERLGLELGGEAAELAKELATRRLAVSHDHNIVFVYAASRQEATRAQAVVEAVLRELGIEGHTSSVEHWLMPEERWDSAWPGDTWEAEDLREGYAPWEVRIECETHRRANELADRLETEGFGVERRWRYVIAGTATEEEAKALADQLHGEVQLGGEAVWESVPGNPFAIFGGMGSSGTPL
jgi:hypothetical protein